MPARPALIPGCYCAVQTRGTQNILASEGGCGTALPCRHFGEAPASARHAMAACKQQCDVCASPGEPTWRDITTEAHALVSVLASVPAQDKRLTLIQLIDRWRASKVLPSPGQTASHRTWQACLVMGVMLVNPCYGAPASHHHALQSPQGCSVIARVALSATK